MRLGGEQSAKQHLIVGGISRLFVHEIHSHGRDDRRGAEFAICG